jgi:hypothetical protein
MSGLIPPTPVVDSRAGASTPSEFAGTPPGDAGEKQVFLGGVAGEQPAETAGVAEHDGAALKPLQPEGADRGGCERAAPQAQPVQRGDESVGAPGEPAPELLRPPGLTAGAVSQYLHLRFLEVSFPLPRAQYRSRYQPGDLPGSGVPTAWGLLPVGPGAALLMQSHRS